MLLIFVGRLKIPEAPRNEIVSETFVRGVRETVFARPTALVQNHHTRELIKARKMSHEHNNKKDPIAYGHCHLACE